MSLSISFKLKTLKKDTTGFGSTITWKLQVLVPQNCHKKIDKIMALLEIPKSVQNGPF